MSLNIKAVSERTGVPLHTLRAWERRYGIPRPQRNAENRYRLYDEDDIADVLWMKRQVEMGVSPAQASALLLQQPRGALHLNAAPTQPLVATQKRLYDAFLQLDESAAQRILNEASSVFSLEQVLLEIIQPTMRQIGSNWQRNLLSVEQEHFASNLVRQRLHALLQAQPPPLLTAPRLVAACAPEEQHDLGLLIFTLLAKRQGWNVNYLGQRTPLTELAHASRDARFGVVSVSTVTGLASLLPIWSQTPLSAPLLFGGEMFNGVAELRERVPGAYLGDDALRAIQTLATTTPRVSAWKPSRRLLNAAYALEDARLDVVSDTVKAFVAAAPKMNADARNGLRHDLTYAALFLTDAFVAALAFDTPAILDWQGSWANVFMPAHRISREQLAAFIKMYERQSARLLTADSAESLHTLVKRFIEALQYTNEDAQEDA